MIFVASFSMQSSGYTTMVSRNERKVTFFVNFFRPFKFQENKKPTAVTNITKVLHYILNLTFRMLQHISSEVTVAKYDKH